MSFGITSFMTSRVQADNRIQPIIVARGTGNQIYNNLLYNNGAGLSQAYSIEVYHALNTEIYNNTIYNSGVDGILIDPEGDGTIVRNNIAYGHSSGDYVNNGTRSTADHNLLGTNPMFMNSAAGNFDLQSGSPALNSGMTLSSVTRDFRGTLRPQGNAYDIGAFEVSAGGTQTGAPAPPTGVRIVQN